MVTEQRLSCIWIFADNMDVDRYRRIGSAQLSFTPETMNNRDCKLTKLCARVAITIWKRCRNFFMFMGATHVHLAQVGRHPKIYRQEDIKEMEWKAAN